MEKYKFNLNESNKTLELQRSGFFNADDANQFISDYKNIVKNIHSKDYIINIDCKNMSIVKADLVDSLSGAIKSYSTDFKKAFFILDKSQLVFKMQLNRLIKKLQVINVSFLE